MGVFKKVLIGSGIAIGLVIAALAVIPFFYSIDDLRPQVRTVLEKQIRGQAEVGQLSLSLLPSIQVKVDGLKLTPKGSFGSRPVVSLGSLKWRMPWVSLLTGPQLTMVVEQPKVDLISQGERSNLSDLLPPASAIPSDGPPPSEAAPPEAASQSVESLLAGLPPWLGLRVKAARLALLVDEGEISIENRLMKTDSTALHKLSLHATNIGIAVPVAVLVTSEIDVKSGEIRAKGPVRIEGAVTVTPQGEGFVAVLDLLQDLTGLDVQMPTLFHKKTGVPFKVGFKGDFLQAKTVDLRGGTLDFRFGDFSLKGSLSAKNLSEPSLTTVALKLSTPHETPIGPFGAIVPLIQDFKLDGRLGLDVDVQGSVADPSFHLVVSLNGVTGATPQLKKPVRDLKGKIVISGSLKKPVIKVDPFYLKIAASDLALKLETVGMDPITAQLSLASQRLDVDELLGLEALRLDVPPPASGAPAGKGAPSQGSASSAGTPGATTSGSPANASLPLDESLNALAPVLETALTNPLLDQASALVTLNFKSVRAMGAEFKDAKMSVTYAKRVLKIFKTGVVAYGGKVDASGEMGLVPKEPSFDFKLGLGGVGLESMLSTHAPSWKGMLTGLMTGDLSLAGKGLRREQLNSHLTGSLQGQVVSGRLNLPIVKVISGALDRIPKQASQKVNEQVKDQEHHGEFKSMKLVALIKGRRVELKDLDVDYDTVKAGLGSFRFQATGTVGFDQQIELMGTAYLPPDVVRIGELRGPSGKNEIPLRMSGPMADPKPDYAYTLKILGPRLAQNALKSRVADELKQKVAPEIKKLEEKAPEPVKQKINDLRKKFGF